MAKSHSTVTPARNGGAQPTGTDEVPLLFEHDDGRYAVADTAALADFCRGDPAWHRLGPIAIVRRADGGAAQAAPEADADHGDEIDTDALLYRQLQLAKYISCAAENESEHGDVDSFPAALAAISVLAQHMVAISVELLSCETEASHAE